MAMKQSFQPTEIACPAPGAAGAANHWRATF
jgi:hypothetical protein